MNKKITAAFTAVLLIIPATAHAALKNQTVLQPTLAILDTAIDTSLPEFKDKIVAEVCVLEYSTCPNGQAFMEGPGAASMLPAFISKNGFDHGTQVAYAAVKTNPNVKIVFVRIIGATANGTRQISTEKTNILAFNWVLANKDRFNIKAVSLSQSHHALLNGANYCPSTPMTSNLVDSMLSAGIPLFNAAGNEKDYSRINWPACIPNVVAVGASAEGDIISPISNFDKNLIDFYTLGTMRVKIPGGKEVNAAGTSISTAVLASTYLAVSDKNPTLSYIDIVNKFNQNSIQIVGRNTFGKLVNVSGLVNG